MVKEIRPINGELYYCNVDYTKNKYGDIISITKRVCAPLNNTKSEIKDDKIVNVNDEKLNDNQIGEIDNQIKEEETMVDANDIRRQIMDELEQKQRTEKMEQELAETKAYLNSIDKTLDHRIGNLGDKIDRIALTASQQKQPSKPDIHEIMTQIKAKSAQQVPSKDELDCPGCSKDGHKHKLAKTSSGTLKCTGEHCGIEYLLAPKKSDAYCVDCGFPINSKHPPSECPECGGHKANFRNQ